MPVNVPHPCSTKDATVKAEIACLIIITPGSKVFARAGRRFIFSGRLQIIFDMSRKVNARVKLRRDIATMATGNILQYGADLF